jgi:hypothetical protein
MSFAAKRDKLKEKQAVARAKLQNLKDKGKGDSERADKIRANIQERKDQLSNLKASKQLSKFNKEAGTGSAMIGQSLNTLTELGNKYADNEMIGGLVVGSIADFARTQGNTGLAIQYNDAYNESIGRITGNLENLRTGNTQTLMAEEAQLTGGLMDKQGDLQTQGLQTAGEEQRKGIIETGNQTRLNLSTKGAEDRLGLETAGEQQRLGMETQGAQDRLGMETKGAQDRLSIQETGRQDRMGVRERTQQQRDLRADARGAIRRSGARFFG